MRLFLILISFIFLFSNSYSQHSNNFQFKPHLILKMEGGYGWQPGQFFKNGTSIQDRQRQNFQYSFISGLTAGYQFNRVVNINIKGINVPSRRRVLSGIAEPGDLGSDSLQLDNQISIAALLVNLDVNIPLRNIPWLFLNFEGGAGAAFFKNFDNSIDLRRNIPYSFLPQTGWNLAGYLNFYASFKVNRGIFILAGFDALGFEDSPHERMRVYTGIRLDFQKK